MKEKITVCFAAVKRQLCALPLRARIALCVVVLAVLCVGGVTLAWVCRVSDAPDLPDASDATGQNTPTDDSQEKTTDGSDGVEQPPPTDPAATKPTEPSAPSAQTGANESDNDGQDEYADDGQNDAEDDADSDPAVQPSGGGTSSVDPTRPSAQPSGGGTAPSEVSVNASTAPEVTLCAQVGTGIYIVGGSCTADTEFVQVSGAHTQTVQIIPTAGRDKKYFFGQVHISLSTTLEIRGQEPGRDLSVAVKKAVTNRSMQNLMTSNEYMPVFGKQSRIHFYSAILAYTLSDATTPTMRSRARSNITRNVQTVKQANPEAELIYLVVPSSAAVYPETLPDGYTAAAGNTVFDVFSGIAESCGATVIYPLDTFAAHKDDGAGYKIYQNTDSHWSAYGAYYGVSALMEHIAKKYPAAAPRTVGEMGFTVTELWGGDALFSFGDGNGFENISNTGESGRVPVTRIGELTTLYTRAMPTATLSTVYHDNRSAYIGQGNSDRADFYHPSPNGLPTALIVRDSFGCTAYDMINDRFSTVWWQGSHRYTFPTGAIEANCPDYVIYIVSERNLIKVMLENSDASITSLIK